ncbi:MAG: DNA-binding protein [Lachnospiraceae bacterium]|nr:DNA-binding protein [Lachnospiraceae bacterium]
MVLAILIWGIIIAVFLWHEKKYRETTYYQITKLPYFAVRSDIGKYGEFKTYQYLKHFENSGGKFLFNVYLPTEDGKTSEVDVILICPKGLFVFESKNYSGWIFGDEKSKNWTQTLPQGRKRSHKESFYNPIMQNRTHIRHLKHILDNNIPMHSIIVFSERCTLKKVTVTSSDIRVINRYDITKVVSQIYAQMATDVLSTTEVFEIYNKLYPYTQVSSAVKTQHIVNIKQNIAPQSVRTMHPEKKLRLEETTEREDTSQLKDTMQTKKESSSENPPPSEDILPLLCPKCGGKLILRTAKRGTNIGKPFYGCENFPKCRHMQELQNNANTV